MIHCITQFNDRDDSSGPYDGAKCFSTVQLTYIGRFTNNYSEDYPYKTVCIIPNWGEYTHNGDYSKPNSYHTTSFILEFIY